MKKTRLFDFSFFAVLAALIVFFFLGILCFNWFYYEKKMLFGVLLLLLISAFLYILYVFVVKAPYLDQGGAHEKGLFIPRERLEVNAEYDIRFRESTYYLRDRETDYRALEGKELAASQIRVQATMANTRKLTEYMHTPMTPSKRFPLWSEMLNVAQR